MLSIGQDVLYPRGSKVMFRYLYGREEQRRPSLCGMWYVDVVVDWC